MRELNVLCVLLAQAKLDLQRVTKVTCLAWPLRSFKQSEVSIQTATTSFVAWPVWAWKVKRATEFFIFKSFCSNVAKQVTDLKQVTICELAEPDLTLVNCRHDFDFSTFSRLDHEIWTFCQHGVAFATSRQDLEFSTSCRQVLLLSRAKSWSSKISPAVSWILKILLLTSWLFLFNTYAKSLYLLLLVCLRDITDFGSLN